MAQRYLMGKYGLDGATESDCTANFKCPDPKCHNWLKTPEQKVGQPDTCPYCGVRSRLVIEPLQLRKEADVAQEQAEKERVQQATANTAMSVINAGAARIETG